MSVKFKDIKEELKDVIERKLQKTGFVKENSKFMIYDEFLELKSGCSYLKNGALESNRATLPVVMVVGNETGEAKFFPLYELMPNLKDDTSYEDMDWDE